MLLAFAHRRMFNFIRNAIETLESRANRTCQIVSRACEEVGSSKECDYGSGKFHKKGPDQCSELRRGNRNHARQAQQCDHRCGNKDCYERIEEYVEPLTCHLPDVVDGTANALPSPTVLR